MMMPDSTRQMIEEFEKLTVSELRERYIDVFGEATRSGNRAWLLRRIAWRVQANAEGDLTDRAKRLAVELVRDADIRLRPPKDRGPALGADVRVMTGRVKHCPDERLPIPGSVLMRTFKGVEHHVAVLQNGFEYDGSIYRSLSAVCDGDLRITLEWIPLLRAHASQSESAKGISMTKSGKGAGQTIRCAIYTRKSTEEDSGAGVQLTGRPARERRGVHRESEG